MIFVSLVPTKSPPKATQQPPLLSDDRHVVLVIRILIANQLETPRFARHSIFVLEIVHAKSNILSNVGLCRRLA